MSVFPHPVPLKFNIQDFIEKRGHVTCRENGCLIFSLLPFPPLSAKKKYLQTTILILHTFSSNSVSKMSHTRSTKSPDVHQNSNDETLNKPEAGSSELAAHDSCHYGEKNIFFKSQFTSLNRKLNDIQSDLANSTMDVQKRTDCNDLYKRMVRVEKKLGESSEVVVREAWPLKQKG